jgi:hypothetical protein
MTWIKLDDAMADHPKYMELDGPFAPLALALQVRALCYSSRHLTDGRIPEAALPSLLTGFSELGIETGGVAGIATFGQQANDWNWGDIMVHAGLWDRVKGGYRIHDFLDYNPSRKDVLIQRAANKKRQANFRDRHAGNEGEDSRNVGSNAVTHPVTSRNGVTNALIITPRTRTRTRTPTTTDTTPKAKTISKAPADGVTPPAAQSAVAAVSESTRGQDGKPTRLSPAELPAIARAAVGA